MSEILIIFYQSLATIILIIFLGFYLGRRKIITASANKTMTELLLSVTMPCSLFMAFPLAFDRSELQLLLQAVVGGGLVLALGIIASLILFRPQKKSPDYFQHQFAYIFNNASFLGYPLTYAVFGEEKMIIYSGLMLVFNFFLFSYGVWLFQRQFTFKNMINLFLNPNIIAILLGLLFFLNSWTQPPILRETIKTISNLTTPLSLLCIGFMLSQVRHWWTIITKKQLFWTCLLQLLLMPTVSYLFLCLFHFDGVIVQMFTMIMSLPTATSLALFAEKYGGYKTEASELVLISTILSIFTLPLMMTLFF